MIAETLAISSLMLSNPDMDFTLPEPPQVEIQRISKLEKQRRKAFQFVHVENIPTDRDLRISKILHTLDVMTTIYAMENRENIREGNILLGPRPSNANIIGQKTIMLTLVNHNFEREQIVFMNWVAGAVIVNNLYVIDRYD